MVNKQPFDDSIESEEPDVEGHLATVHEDDAEGPGTDQ
jgi:hypothetical protein